MLAIVLGCHLARKRCCCHVQISTYNSARHLLVSTLRKDPHECREAWPSLHPSPNRIGKENSKDRCPVMDKTVPLNRVHQSNTRAIPLLFRDICYTFLRVCLVFRCTLFLSITTLRWYGVSKVLKFHDIKNTASAKEPSCLGYGGIEEKHRASKEVPPDISDHIIDTRAFPPSTSPSFLVTRGMLA